MKNFLLFSCLMLLLFFSANITAGQKRIDSILATVNGAPISLLDVLLESTNQEKRLQSVYKGQDLEQEIRQLRKSVLKQIVERKLIYEDYQNYKFKIPPQYIEDTLQDLANAISDGTIKGLKKQAEKFGTSIDELRAKAKEKVCVDIMILEFCFRNVNITPKEVYEYYKQNLPTYSKDSEVLLEVILVSKDGKNKERYQHVINEIKKEIKSKNPAIFKTLVKLYSEGPDNKNSGRLGWVEERKLRPEFAPMVTDAEIGTIHGPLATPEGTYFIRIADRKREKEITFSEIKDEIKNKLERKEREKVYKKYVDDLKKHAVIRYFF